MLPLKLVKYTRTFSQSLVQSTRQREVGPSWKQDGGVDIATRHVTHGVHNARRRPHKGRDPYNHRRLSGGSYAPFSAVCILISLYICRWESAHSKALTHRPCITVGLPEVCNELGGPRSTRKLLERDLMMDVLAIVWWGAVLVFSKIFLLCLIMHSFLNSIEEIFTRIYCFFSVWYFPFYY